MKLKVLSYESKIKNIIERKRIMLGNLRGTGPAAAVCEEKRSHFAGMISEMHVEIDGLADMVTRLTERISPVLLPSCPDKPEEAAPPCPIETPLSRTIHEATGKIVTIKNHIRSRLLERIEL
jgi:hypothetical protein